MLQELSRGRAVGGVNGEACAHKVLGRLRHVLPELGGGELVVAVADGLHLLVLRVAVEGGVATKKEVAGGTGLARGLTARPRCDAYVMTPMAQMSTGLPWPDFLKISG